MKNPLLTILVLCMAVMEVGGQTSLLPGDSVRRNILFAETQTYKVKTKKGELIELLVKQEGIDVAISLIASGKKDSAALDIPSGLNERKLVSFESKFNGEYIIQLKPTDDTVYNTKTGAYVISYLKRISAQVYQQQLKKMKAEEDSLVYWIQNNAVHIKSVKPESGLEDLQGLKKVLANKKLIAIGESTHGTREFFQMRHRFFEFLVKEMGFTVFGLEADYSRCRYINEYVMGGKGSLDTALAVLGSVVGSIEENRALIQWMREYNKQESVQKVQFIGYDIQGYDAAAYNISRFYHKVEPAKKESIDSLLRMMVKVSSKGGVLSGDTTIRTLIQPIQSLIVNLVQKKGQYLQTVSAEEYEQAFWSHKLLHQFFLSYGYDSWASYREENRDFYMAQNLLSLLTQLPQNTKMLISAHNGHIAKDFLNEYYNYPSMGSHLRKILGERYYTIGLDFYRGQFQAMDADTKNAREMVPFVLGDAPEGFFSNYCVKAGIDMGFLDFTMTDKSELMNSWLQDRYVYLYNVGSRFSKRSTPESYASRHKLYQSFDGAIFIKESTRATPVKRFNVTNYKF